MVMAAQAREVVRIRLPVPCPGDGVVDVTQVRVPAAAREPAPVIPQLQEPAEAWWGFVMLPPDLDDRVGAGIHEDPVETRRLRREPAGGDGVDGPVAAEVARFVRL